MAEWKVGKTKTVLKTFIWNVEETEKTDPAGKSGKFVSLKAPNWCSAVILNTDTNKIVMVKEFRQGVNKYVYEFPSGTVEEGENAADACIREVKEETGYENVEIVRTLYVCNPNPAFMNNSMQCFFVKVSGERKAQKLDEHEFINVFEVDNPEDYLNAESSVMGKLAWVKAQSCSDIVLRKKRSRFFKFCYNNLNKLGFFGRSFEV